MRSAWMSLLLFAGCVLACGEPVEDGAAPPPPPVCPTEVLCEVRLQNPDDECEVGPSSTLVVPPDEVDDVRCFFTALRDRTPGNVSFSWSGNGGLCGRGEQLTISGARARMEAWFQDDNALTEFIYPGTLHPPEIYQACLDRPDAELIECFQDSLMDGHDNACPPGCDCEEESPDDDFY